MKLKAGNLRSPISFAQTLTVRNVVRSYDAALALVTSIIRVRGAQMQDPQYTHTVRDGALGIASKEFAGDLGADSLGKIRNRLRFPLKTHKQTT